MTQSYPEISSRILDATVVSSELTQDEGTDIYTYIFRVEYQLSNPSTELQTGLFDKDCDGTYLDLFYSGIANQYYDTTCSRASVERNIPSGFSNYIENKSISIAANNIEGINSTGSFKLIPGDYSFRAFSSGGAKSGRLSIHVGADFSEISSQSYDNIFFPQEGTYLTDGTNSNSMMTFPVLLLSTSIVLVAFASGKHR